MKNAISYKMEENEVPRKRVRNETEELIMCIESVKAALNSAYANFEWATEPSLVDSSIYEVNAIQLKYEYLLRQAKELGIISNRIEYTCKKDR